MTHMMRESVDSSTSDLRVSVVIPCYNALPELAEQLDALAAQLGAPAFEVVLSDNGSSDGLVEYVRKAVSTAKWPFPLLLVDASSRRGVAHARNAGVASAQGDLVLICDADDVVDSGWVAAMVSGLREADLVCGTLVSDDINDEVVRQWRPMYPAGVLPHKLNHLPYAVGANTGLRREVFDAIGGWDESFVAGGDDVEFSWRAQHGGYTLRAAPDAVIRYRLRGSLRAMSRQSYFYARSDAQLLRTFRTSGVRRTSLKAPCRELRWLLANLRSLTQEGPRGLWLRRLAMLAGRVVGSWQYRAWAV